MNLRTILNDIWWGTVVLWVVAVIAISLANAHDDMYGTNYRDWTNKRGGDCCNGKDCREIDNKDVREVNDHYEIRIDGTWCPVEPWKFTQTGNNPNGYVHHACILGYSSEWSEPGPCGRLVCFRPQTGF